MTVQNILCKYDKNVKMREFDKTYTDSRSLVMPRKALDGISAIYGLSLISLQEKQK